MTKIKKPKNLSQMGVRKADSKVTRQMKRHATINVNGRTVRVLDHLHTMAKKLSAIVKKGTTEEFDHYEHMKGIYMEAGIDGVNEYLTTCRNIVKRDRGRWWLVRWFARIQLSKRKYKK